MLKKIFVTLLTLSFASLVHADANTNQPVPNKNSANSPKMNERFQIMEANQNEDTDTLAIPLDSSEVEDEEEIDRLEGQPFKIDFPTKNDSQNHR